MKDDLRDLVAEVERHTRVWLSTLDFAKLLKAGMPMTDARTVLRSGVLAMWKATQVYVDRTLAQGCLRLLGGEVIRIGGSPN